MNTQEPVDSSFATPAQPAVQRGKEIRLGLVMYGGVSLAIYINGVSRELFELARNKHPQAEKSFYDLLKEVVDADVVIDILSGTSAGGINAILLAYALTNGKNFHSTADFWRRNGDIEDLLKKPEKQRTEDDFRSLLDGDHYHEQLVRAFREMPVMQSKQTNIYCDKAQKSELDLFVTGTNVAGRIYTVFDDQGAAIDVKDHRTVFQLKHRPGRREPFKSRDQPDPEESRYSDPEECFQSLGKLARITSSFPVAFSPVEVKINSSSAPDKLLTQWGQLQKQTGSGSSISSQSDFQFMDGGLLDNKPFTHTIREIFSRTADRPVERYLLYVEPDPERFTTAESMMPSPGLSLLQAANRGGYSIRTYESIADDLKLITQHNARVEQRKELSKCIQKRIQDNWQNNWPEDQLIPGSDCGCAIQASIAIAARLEALQRRALKGILKDRGRERYVDNLAQKELLKPLIKAFMQWGGDGKDTLRNFDVYFRQRRVQHLVYRVHDYLNGTLPFLSTYPSRGVLFKLLEGLNRHSKFLDIIQFAMEEGIDQWSIIDWESSCLRSQDFDPAMVWIHTERAFRYLLFHTQWDPLVSLLMRSEDHLDQNTLKNIKSRLDGVRRYVERNITNLPGSLDADAEHSLLKWSDKALVALLEHYLGSPSRQDRPDSLWSEFRQFVCLDAFQYPVEYAVGRPERDIIKLARLSSLDVKGGCNNLHPFSSDREARIGRLAGRTLAHFGGFLKQSWRANDILWGRLDGASKLIELLLSNEHLRDPEAQRRLKELLGHPASYFPNAHAVFADGVASLRSSTTFDVVQWRDLLTDMAHYEILNDEARPFFECVVDQQFKWQTGAFRVKAQAESETKGQPWFIWQHRREISADPILSHAYSEINASRYPDLKEPSERPAVFGDTKLVTWFRMAWSTIASETGQPLKTPPPVVTANLVLQMAVVLRNCLLREFSKEMQTSVTNQVWYRLLFGFPLDAALTTVRSWRQEPLTFVIMRTVGIVLSLSVLLIQVYQGHTIGQGQKDSATIGSLLAWWGIPLFILWTSIGRQTRLITGWAVPSLFVALGVLVWLSWPSGVWWSWFTTVGVLQRLGNVSITTMDALAVGVGAAFITSIILRWMNKLWKA